MFLLAKRSTYGVLPLLPRSSVSPLQAVVVGEVVTALRWGTAVMVFPRLFNLF